MAICLIHRHRGLAVLVRSYSIDVEFMTPQVGYQAAAIRF